MSPAELLVKKGEVKKLPPAQGDTYLAGLGWDPAAGQGSVDLDSWVIRRRTDGTVEAIFWGNKPLWRPDLGANSEGSPWIATPEEDVIHQGDDRTGAESDAGYDEIIQLNLGKTPADVDQYAFFVTLYEDPPQGNTLGIATNVVCAVEAPNGNKLSTQLESDHGFDLTVLVCTIDRRDDGNGWDLNAKQTGFDDSMFDVAKKLGVVGFP
jgi:tellurium resistance protein TerD